MSDQKTGRRKLLKSIATGSSAIVAVKSFPETWAKPVVNAVILPTHAATTDDTGSGPGDPTTTTTTAEPCVIEGQYCWIQNNFIATFDVDANGGITITRVKTTEPNAGRTWTGTGNTSNGAMGGTFVITVIRTSGGNAERVYTGTIVCNATSISGTFDNPSNVNPPVNYEATQDACTN